MRHLVLLFMLCTALAAGAKSRFSYSYSPGNAGGDTISQGDLEDVLRVRRKLGTGRYLWARLDGREYVIDEDAVLDRVDDILKPHRELHRELDKLRNQIEPVERRSERLEEQIDTITDRDEEEISREDERRVRELEKQLRTVEQQLRPLEQRRRELERREESLDRRLDTAIRELVTKAVRQGVAERMP